MYFILFLLGAAVFMLLLSQPVELRAKRGLKMAISLPLLAISVLIMQANARAHATAIGQVTSFVFFFAMAALIWTPNLAWFGGRIITGILHSSGGGGGWVPDFYQVRRALEKGQVDEAQELLNEQLEKAPNNYEGLLLQAQIWLDKKQPPMAVKALEAIVASPSATEEQKAVARSEKQRIEFEFAPTADADEAPPAAPANS
jgi:hypothetical protein